MARIVGLLCLTALSFSGPGRSPKPKDVPIVKVEIRRAQNWPAAGLIEMSVVGEDRKIYLRAHPDLTNADVASAEAVPATSNNCFNIEITFTAAGAEKMSKISAGHILERLAILVDGVVVSAPVIHAQIRERAVISGNFTQAEAERIAAGLSTR